MSITNKYTCGNCYNEFKLLADMCCPNCKSSDIVPMPEPEIDEKLLAQLHELVSIQGANGNWNYDSYMHGMYNGMELLLAMIERREPNFKKAPEEWIHNRKVEDILPLFGKKS